MWPHFYNNNNNIFKINIVLKLQFLTQSLANTNYSSYKVFTSPHGIFIQKNANCISSYTIFYMPKRYPKYSDQFSKFTAGSRIYLETIDLGS